MFQHLEKIYFIVFIAALLASLFARRADVAGIDLLRILLCCGLANEALVYYLKWRGLGSSIPHYIYIPLEYALLALFYRKIADSFLLRRVMLFSIPAYLLITFLLYTGISTGSFFPSLPYLFSCFLNIVWLVLLFFYVKPLANASLTRLPVFWILAAFLIFYAGVFFFIATYEYFLKHAPGLADRTRTYINMSLNIVLYVLLTYAFLCSRRMKKYM